MNIEELLHTDFGVSPIDIEKAKSYQQKFGGRLEKLLVNIGSLAEEQLIPLYAKFFSLPMLDPKDIELAELDLSSLDVNLLLQHHWLPIGREDTCWHFITNDPLCWEANQYLLSSDIPFSLSLANKSDIETLEKDLKLVDKSEDSEIGLSDFEEDKLRELATEAPTVNLLNSLIARGVKKGASDMHLEPVSGRYKIRYRVDGVLSEDGTLPISLQLAVISRIKILSNMDIAEKRRPQDGKIETRISNIELDIRVSALPLNKGESIVMRFLRKDAITYDMDKLGISSDIRTKLERDLTSTSGVILLTGPTGSGKTTSLYTFLHELNDSEVKIITLEDPVEYQLEGVNQVQVNPDIGFDFAAGLRSIVRQDPDIIMLGEIRDKETAQIAMQSALTGHLVFSTVHTNDAPSAYTRLIDLGVEEFLLNAAIISVVAQRLVRKICPHCRVSHPNAQQLVVRHGLEALSERFGVTKLNLMEAKGCEQCGHSGFKGRIAILEYLRCDDDIRNLRKDEYFIPQAREINRQAGNRTLMEDGLLKAMRGETTIDEVMRVCA